MTPPPATPRSPWTTVVRRTTRSGRTTLAPEGNPAGWPLEVLVKMVSVETLVWVYKGAKDELRALARGEAEEAAEADKPPSPPPSPPPEVSPARSTVPAPTAAAWQKSRGQAWVDITPVATAPARGNGDEAEWREAPGKRRYGKRGRR